MIRKLAVWLFRCFASLRLAISLLLALAAVFAAGTFIESAYGTEAAKLLVYRSHGLSLLLILLVLNVAAAALERLPWKKKHVGFVITHAGIIVILTGALVTQARGVEGQLALAEGETQGRIILGEPMLQIFSKDSTPLAFFRFEPRAFPWRGQESLHPEGRLTESLPHLRLLRYLPKSSRKEALRESPNGPAALELVLESSFLKQNHWLVLGDPTRDQISLGPAELRFTREPMVPEKTEQENSSRDNFLEFQFENSTVKIPIPEKTPKKFSLKGTPYEVTILRVLKDAVVDGAQLVDRSTEWNNPACELVLEGEGIQETHTVFSNFPDFPSLHGIKPSAAGAKIYYHRSNLEKRRTRARNELRLIWQEGSLPAYQIRKGEEISQGRLELGQDYPTGWMDFKFRVERSLAHARIESTFQEEPVASESEEHFPSLEVELEKGGERKTLSLGQGDRGEVSLGGERFQIVYGLRTIPVGFRLALRDFRMERYPGTNQPASFESDVTVIDDFQGREQEATIRMNQPLRQGGFKVFQSGYQQLPGQPEVSIFTVAKDPGIPVKYGGALILIGGILTMFYTRRFSGRIEETEDSRLVSAGNKKNRDGSIFVCSVIQRAGR